MHVEFCAKLNFLEGEYAIMQNIGFLLSWVGNPCRYLVLRPCKIRTDFVDVRPPCVDRDRDMDRGARASHHPAHAAMIQETSLKMYDMRARGRIIFLFSCAPRARALKIRQINSVI